LSLTSIALSASASILANAQKRIALAERLPDSSGGSSALAQISLPFGILRRLSSF
jgi:hypothetical protein